MSFLLVSDLNVEGNEGDKAVILHQSYQRLVEFLVLVEEGVLR